MSPIVVRLNVPSLDIALLLLSQCLVIIVTAGLPIASGSARVHHQTLKPAELMVAGIPACYVDLVLGLLQTCWQSIQPDPHFDDNPLLEHATIAALLLETVPKDSEEDQFLSWLFEWLFGYEYRATLYKTAIPHPNDAVEVVSEPKANTFSPVKTDVPYQVKGNSPSSLLEPGSKLYNKYQGWRKSVLAGVQMGRLCDKL